MYSWVRSFMFLVFLGWSHPSASSEVYFSDNNTIQRYGVAGVDTIYVGHPTDHYHWIDIDERNRRLYFSGACVNCETTFIRWADIEGPNSLDVFLEDFGAVWYRGVVLHPWEERLYWGFRGRDGSWSIRRSQRDGSSIESVVDSAGPDQWGIAVDTVNGYVYWTAREDSVPGTGAIRRARIDGGSADDVITGLERPASVVVDVGGGKLYWTDYEARKIQRANLWNGGNVEDLVLTVDHPFGIDVDAREGKLYWTAGTTLQRSNLDGSGEETIVTGYWLQALKISNTFPTAVEDQSPTISLRVSTTAGRMVVFSLELPHSSALAVDLFSVAGRRVQRLAYELLKEGEHQIIWDGTDRVGRRVPSGMYFYKVQVNRQSITGNCVILK